MSKPYMLLLSAMSETKYYALAKIAMHGREHIVVIRPTRGGLVLHTMYFVEELQNKNAPKIPKSGGHSAKELELARTLVNRLAGEFKPEQYHDEYRENVERLLARKQRGQKVTPVKQPKTRPVVNIMEALQKSLAESGKSKPAAKTKRTRKAA